MRAQQHTKWRVAGILALGILAILLWLSRHPDIDTQWRDLRPGMTQADVRRIMGAPIWAGKSEVIGKGGENVLTWRYVRGRSISGWWTYSVDFDYVGPGGAPAVFRTTRSWQERSWPSWWPSPRAKAKA